MRGEVAGPADIRTDVRGTAIPILPARAVAETLELFERLGFDIVHDQANGYGFARRGAIELHFTHTPDLDPWTSNGMAYLRVDDVTALYEEFCASRALPVLDEPERAEDLHRRWEAGVSIARMTTLADRPWGMREFALLDPSNNLLRVGQVIP